MDFTLQFSCKIELFSKKKLNFSVFSGQLEWTVDSNFASFSFPDICIVDLDTEKYERSNCHVFCIA